MKMVGTSIIPQVNTTTITGTPHISTMAVCARIVLPISRAAPAGTAEAVKVVLRKLPSQKENATIAKDLELHWCYPLPVSSHYLGS